jgi:hypothetical protein
MASSKEYSGVVFLLIPLRFCRLFFARRLVKEAQSRDLQIQIRVIFKHSDNFSRGGPNSNYYSFSAPARIPIHRRSGHDMKVVLLLWAIEKMGT